VDHLRIWGRLLWDTTKDNLTLRASTILVDECGLFEIGKIDNPMMLRATVYIKNGSEPGHGPGKRYLASEGSGQIQIHGKPMANTWTLLTRTAWGGDNWIDVQHDISDWNVNDQITLAMTSLYVMSHSWSKKTETFWIQEIQGQRIRLDRGMEEPRLGDPNTLMQAEVINTTRNIQITGDDFDGADHGLHTRCHGYCRITYSHVSKCGQRGLTGKYCLHFHHAYDCPACLFKGNSVTDSKQRGIIIHGTHRSNVRGNVMHHVKGAGVYVEDGNELYNNIVSNVNLCHQRGGDNPWNCRISGTDNDVADNVHQSGMWALSPTNNFLYNRMVGHQNAFFLTTSAFAHGRGAAQGKVCTRHTPLGIFKGNVHHSSERFGFYLDAQWPRRVKRSIASNGMVEDMAECFAGRPCSCDSNLPDGTDNGAYGVVEDGLDYFNIFTGQYELGDVQYLRWNSLNNLHGMYWKHTKNFYGKPNHAHIKDSIFNWIVTDEIKKISGTVDMGTAAIAGPGGTGAFLIENTQFKGRWSQMAAANQHCAVNNSGTGGLCTPEYVMKNVHFDEGSLKIRFGISGGLDKTPIFNAPAGDNSLNGARSMVNGAQGHLLNLPECDWSGQWDFHDAIRCSIPVRRLQVWSYNQGNLNLHGPNGGFHSAEHIFGHGRKQGYGMNVASDRSYTLELSDPGAAVIEFADEMFAGEKLTLTVKRMGTNNQRTCVVDASHSRNYLSAFGPTNPDNVEAGICYWELRQI
jgi:parallel beta-helix repeat protein